MGWLGYIGDDTTQFYRDYFISHEIRIPSLTNQYNGKYDGFFRGSLEQHKVLSWDSCFPTFG